MTRSTNSFAACLSAALMGLALGCMSGDAGPELADVSGTVTLDGQPVAGAIVTFFPESDRAAPSYGATDADGRYTLMATRRKPGAPPGRHRVAITVQEVSEEELQELRAAGERLPPTPADVPKKYSESDALTAEVQRGSNQIDFKLIRD